MKHSSFLIWTAVSAGIVLLPAGGHSSSRFQTAASLVAQLTPAERQPVPNQDVVDEVARRRVEIRRNELEIEKLELEIADLRSWWKTFLSLLPSVFTAVAVIVGFWIAKKNGVFEARNRELKAQRDELKAETAFLEVRKSQLERELRVTPVRVLLERVRAKPDVAIGAVEEMIEYVRKLDADRDEAVRIVSDAARLDSGPVALVLLYCLFHATNQRVWFDQLTNRTMQLVPSMDRDSRTRSLAVFGDQKWDKAERVELCRMLLELSGQPDSDYQVQCMEQIARLNAGTWSLPPGQRRFSGREARDRFVLLDRDADTFFGAVARARDIVLAPSATLDQRSRALAALGELAPPAALVTAAALVGNNTDDAERNLFAFRTRLLDVVLKANSVVTSPIHAPLPRRHDEQYDEMDTSRWVDWRTKNQGLFNLLLERELPTVSSKPDLFRQLMRLYEDPYG